MRNNYCAAWDSKAQQLFPSLTGVYLIWLMPVAISTYRWYKIQIKGIIEIASELKPLFCSSFLMHYHVCSRSRFQIQITNVLLLNIMYRINFITLAGRILPVSVQYVKQLYQWSEGLYSSVWKVRSVYIQNRSMRTHNHTQTHTR